MVFSVYLPSGMLDRANTGVGTDGICTGHVDDGMKGSDKGLFKGHYIMAANVVGSAISAWLGMVLLLQGVGVFRADLASACHRAGKESQTVWIPWVWNDTLLVIFWLLIIVTALRRVEDASLGTFNSSIPS